MSERMIDSVATDEMLRELILFGGRSTFFGPGEDGEIAMHVLDQQEMTVYSSAEDAYVDLIPQGGERRTFPRLRGEHSEMLESESYAAWLSELKSVDEILTELTDLYEQRGSADTSATTDCETCDATGERKDTTCFCCYMSEAQEPNPDCGRCEGTGKDDCTCISCNGAGYSYDYPEIVLTNAETGETASLIFDLLGLIAQGHIELDIDVHENLTQQVATYSVRADFTGFIRSLAESIGIDFDRALSSGGSASGMMLDQLMLGSGAEFVYSDSFISEYAEEHYSGVRRELDTHDLQKNITQSQVRGASRFNHIPGVHSHMDDEAYEKARSEGEFQYGIVADKNFAVFLRNHKLVNLPGESEMLGKLVASAAELGGYVRFDYAGIATGEVAPTFFLLKPAAEGGFEQTYIDQDYSLLAALHNSNVRLLELIGQAEAPSQL